MDDGELSRLELDPDREVGATYRGWREGEFDFHLLDVGVAEASFAVYPDGTTALIDCGDRNPDSRGESGRRPRPDPSRRPGEWTARYIARLRPEITTIDYLVATHFHKDHIGSSVDGAGMTVGRGEEYQLSGLSQVGEYYRFGTAFDRGFPDYPHVGEKSLPEVENYRRFLGYHERTFGTRREAFVVGAVDQLGARFLPSDHDFHVRNVCANGRVWLGEKAGTVDLIARAGLDDIRPRLENTMSVGLAVRFGAFRFFIGGDVMNATRDGTWNDGLDVEGPLGRALGPLDACKAQHHASRGSMTPAFVNATRPRAFLVNVWQDRQLKAHALAAMGDDSGTGYPGVRIVCPTGLCAWHDALAQTEPWGRYFVRRSGHVVLKAYAGGDWFKVYYLTSEDESMRVDAVFGPFRSRFADVPDVPDVPDVGGA